MRYENYIIKRMKIKQVNGKKKIIFKIYYKKWMNLNNKIHN